MRVAGIPYIIHRFLVLNDLVTGPLKDNQVAVGCAVATFALGVISLAGTYTSAGPFMAFGLETLLALDLQYHTQLTARWGASVYWTLFSVYLLIWGVVALFVVFKGDMFWNKVDFTERIGLNIGKAMAEFNCRYEAYLQEQESQGKEQRLRAATQSSSTSKRAKKTEWEQRVKNPRAFDDLVGVDHAIQAIKDALELPVLHPEMCKRYNVVPPKGIILYGPPGTGKTSLARATAEYFGCAFRAVKASELMAPLVGESEKALRELFEWERQNKPSILFFDEFDAIGRKRDGMHLNRPSDLSVNILLAELDGFDSNEGVFVIAATNKVELLDEALVRPGRFDRHLEVGLPDESAREKLFKVYLLGKKRPLSADIDFKVLAQRTEGKAPADIADMCNAAATRAAKEELNGRKTGITMVDILGGG
jgi:AAA+ superfamily predicted ATPase